MDDPTKMKQHGTWQKLGSSFPSNAHLFIHVGNVPSLLVSFPLWLTFSGNNVSAFSEPS